MIPPRFDAAYLDNPAPAYPSLARRMGEQGKVLLRVRVNAGGQAEDVQVKTGSGHPRLDEAALSTVKQWRFVPARQGDQPVAAWVLVPIVYRLEGW
ncbi:MAG: energy transducer TonB [Betaproteobacteria bacterium]|nr:energy transducer TonB [Betaproteobacteria bacterium]